MPKKPQYRRRKDRNQALVSLTDSATKRRRDYWLGEYDSPPSHELYHRLIAAWESNGRRWPNLDDIAHDTDGPTVAEIIAPYWRWAEAYYHRNRSGAKTTQSSLNPSLCANWCRPILEDLLEIRERGRSLGVMLMSAQQFASAVHDRIIGKPTSTGRMSRCVSIH